MKDLFKYYDTNIFFESNFLSTLVNQTYSINVWDDGSGNNHCILRNGVLFTTVIDNLKVDFIKHFLHAISFSYQEPHIVGKYHIDDCPRNGVIRQCSLVFPIQNCSPTYFKEDSNVYECVYTEGKCALINVQRTHRVVNASDTRRVTLQICFIESFKNIKTLIDTNINNFITGKDSHGNQRK